MQESLFSFEYHEKPVRTVVVEDESIWFVAKDVCGALGIMWKGTKGTLPNIKDNWVRGLKVSDPLGGRQRMICISEPAVYKFVFSSNKSEAEAFTEWVVSEVLPMLRRTGHYELPEDYQEQMQILKEAIVLERREKGVLEQCLDMATEAAEIYEPSGQMFEKKFKQYEKEIKGLRRRVRKLKNENATLWKKLALEAFAQQKKKDENMWKQSVKKARC